MKGVYTAGGELARHFQTTGFNQSWAVGDMASGLYFIRVKVLYQDGI
jgi:hypothetical protein